MCAYVPLSVSDLRAYSLVGLTSKGLRYLTIDPSTSVNSATTANSGNSASSASSAPAVSAAEPSPPRERRNRDFSPSPPPVHISSVHYTAACIMDTLPDGTKLRQAIEDLKSGKTTVRASPLRVLVCVVVVPAARARVCLCVVCARVCMYVCSPLA